MIERLEYVRGRLFICQAILGGTNFVSWDHLAMVGKAKNRRNRLQFNSREFAIVLKNKLVTDELIMQEEG